MKDWTEKTQKYKEKYPRTWSQQLQKDIEFKEYVITQTLWLYHKPKFSERIYYLENGLTDYKKCECGRDITNLKAETCKKNGCDAFKKLLNIRRDKEKHRQSIKKTYEDGCRNTMSGEDRANISYNNQQKMLENITEIYSLDETICLLKPIYKKYFGKAGNRTLIKDNPKLYKSVKYHTEGLRDKSNTQLRFTGELVFLCDYDGDISKLKCNVDGCDNIISFNAVDKNFKQDVCCDCFEPPICRVSKISQELFNMISTSLETVCIYGSNGGEMIIRLTEQEKRFMRMKGYQYNKFFIDFVCDNKIIEYDGEYWHSSTKEYDVLRDFILTKRGYNVLRIKSGEYGYTRKGMLNKKETIKKCVDFLKE